MRRLSRQSVQISGTEPTPRDRSSVMKSMHLPGKQARGSHQTLARSGIGVREVPIWHQAALRLREGEAEHRIKDFNMSNAPMESASGPIVRGGVLPYRRPSSERSAHGTNL